MATKAGTQGCTPPLPRDYGSFHVQIRNLYKKQAWSICRIAREFGLTKPTVSRVVKGHKIKDPAIIKRLGLTRPWHHLSDLTQAEVAYLFDHREEL